MPNFGVELDKLANKDQYRINGQAVTVEEVHRLLKGSSSIPDDAGKLRLTIIGPEAQRKQILNDLAHAPALANLKDRYVIQDYEPGHWAVAQAGFYTAGRPTIYLQAPDGKVLHRQDDYRDGPQGLANALRKADPSYKPERDPDARRVPAAVRRLLDLPLSYYVLALGLLVLLVRRKS